MAQPLFEYAPKLTVLHTTELVTEAIGQTDELARLRSIHALGLVAGNYFRMYEEEIIKGDGRAEIVDFPEQTDELYVRPHIGLSSPYYL